MARVPYLNPSDLPADTRALLENIKRPNGMNLNLHRAMAHRPDLMRDRGVFAKALLRAPTNLVDGDLREMALLTVGFLARCWYEYHHHVEFGLQEGLTNEKIQGLPFFRSLDIYSAEEKAVIQYAQEMTLNIQVSDATFNDLKHHLSDAQIVELTLAIAHYNSTVRFLEALQVVPGHGGV